ncbi:unnamed protein product [Cuscuta epithymum]|uniref:Uncharacterized protein n=1 Tax=Cuscuta epithymum TaxID=186058 RepID=A0AAV0CPT5_9ASTE|nr:unnamed protein product [Cuscuta epithymum]
MYRSLRPRLADQDSQNWKNKQALASTVNGMIQKHSQWVYDKWCCCSRCRIWVVTIYKFWKEFIEFCTSTMLLDLTEDIDSFFANCSFLKLFDPALIRPLQ